MNRSNLKAFVVTICLFVSSLSHADFEFDNLNEDDVKTVISELGTSFSHTTVSSAGSLGKIFGIEAAIVGGVVESKGIDRLVQESSSDGEGVEVIPYGAIIAAVSLPMGLGGEVSFIPSQEAFGDFEYNKLGFAFKWTLTDALLALPFDMSVKAHHTVASLSFDQTINNSSTGNTDVNATVDYSSNISGLQLIVGKSLLLVSPYIGIGYIRVDGELEVSASGGGTIFDPSFSSAQTVDELESGFEYFAGLQLNLLIIRAAVEVGKVLDNTKVAVKLGLKF